MKPTPISTDEMVQRAAKRLDGWRVWTQIPGLLLHFGPSPEGGRLVVTGVHFERADGVRGSDLAAVRISAIEEWLNAEHGSSEVLPPRPTKRELRLPRAGQPQHRREDGFYARLGALYPRLVAHGIRPAPAIAEANDVPVTTVHRWVREARRRGFLAPARSTKGER